MVSKTRRFPLPILKESHSPERHEHSVEYSSWMVEKVGDTGVVTDLIERPGTAVGALGTHRDVFSLRTTNFSGGDVMI